MQKGTLSISIGKKQNLILKLTREDNKTMPVVGGIFVKNKVLIEKGTGDFDVEYLLINGQIAKLKIDEDLIVFKREEQSSSSTGQGTKPNMPRGDLDGATAPYNFIPLNEIVLPSDQENLPGFDVSSGLDGYLDLEIRALSPLYIRQTLTEEELKAQKGQSDNENKEGQSGFFRPAKGKYRIPGSSLRGMIRNLCEIVTYSNMEHIDDYKLYFRSFADSSIEFKNRYSNYMIEQIVDVYKPKVKAGYLRCEGRDNYKIYEAESYHRVEEALALKSQVATEKMCYEAENRCRKSKSYIEAIIHEPYKKVFFKADSEKVHQHSKKLKYSAVTEIVIDQGQNMPGFRKGVIVFSGWVPSERKGKHMHWVIAERSNHFYPVSKEQIWDYKNDKGKDKDATDLLKYAKDKDGCPCFFIVEEGKVKAFGHTGMFRMVYSKSIGDLRHGAYDKNIRDMAQSIFGRVQGNNAIPGRVYFEDAICLEAKELEAGHPRILSGPKPSTFQHYLAQDISKLQTVKGKSKIMGLKNYDSQGAQLAGHKLYWHRKHEDWRAHEETVKKHPDQYTFIQPLDAGSRFLGRIRFINLSDEELGALLFVLNLPEGCHHKLGMGKPLGLGSVAIKASLKLIDRKVRYSDLASTGEYPEDPEKFKKAFSAWLGKGLNKEITDPWQIDRLKHLKAMLNYKNCPDNESTRYMEIQRSTEKNPNEFKSRRILKKPAQMIKSGS